MVIKENRANIFKNNQVDQLIYINGQKLKKNFQNQIHSKK